MATVKVNITAPLPNAPPVVSRTIAVSATTTTSNATDQLVSIDLVEVQFGVGTPFVPANKVGTSWRRTGTVPIGSGGGSTVKISARAIWRQSPRPPEPPDWSEPMTSQETSVSVVLEATPPVVTVDAFDQAPPPGLLTLSGTAQDVGSGVSVVQYQIGSSSYAATDNITGDWSQWRKTLNLPAGEYLIKIQAIDKFRNSKTKELNISVRTPFQPTNAELAFAPVTYLQELAVGEFSFAKRWIKIGSTGLGPTAQDLTHRFYQPFDRLTLANHYERATKQVHQTRIAVEVLRERLRQINAVYEALLLQFGTSQEELRAARIADEATRRALAERLGLGVESARPDRLDQITLMPDQVTETKLKQLFGLEITNDDPLLPMNAGAEVLNWRLGATRDRWVLEDAQLRNGVGGPVPIIDPDLVGEANLNTTTAGDRVYDLWRARKSWLDQKLAETAGQRQQGLEQVVNTFIGDLDIPALAAQDADGVDISGVLDPLNLGLDAFRFLRKCRELAIAGELLETEWRDILDIVVQVQKRRQYPQWRIEESGLSLAPQYFQLAEEQGLAPTASPWRAKWSDYAAWRRTLTVRIRQLQDVKDAYQSALDAAEESSLPVLRNSLIEIIGRQATPPENVAVAAERLTRELVIDLRANASQKTTRVNQAIETLLGALFSVRAGRLSTDPTSPNWSIDVESDFDLEWQWMSAYRTWRAAMIVFAYPESQLYPNFFITEEPSLNPTQAYKDLIATLRDTARMTPAVAREKAKEYLGNLRAELASSLPPLLMMRDFTITEQVDLVQRKALVTAQFASVTQPHTEANYLREIFWLVPIALALQLQRAGHYLVALDWYQTVYAFNLPRPNRKIYRGLELEERITSEYARVPEWLVEELNPHIFARKRKNAYTRFTVLSIARCFLDYADAEFSQSTAESVGRARTLYETAEDLLNLPDVKPQTGPDIPFLPDPIWESLRLHARANLTKIHNGLNIAGMPLATPLTSDASTILPSQYRYAALVERAKQLVGIAQQVESAFLAAMERRDAEAYSLMQAVHDLRVAGATVSLQDLKITDADLSVQMTQLQQEKAQIQVNYFDDRLSEGLNSWEKTALAATGTAIYLQTMAGGFYSYNVVLEVAKSIFSLGLFGSPGNSLGNALSAYAGAASSAANLAQTMASFERREQDWRLQKSLSEKDVQCSP